MIKVDLITGFLGAGKTTFLQKYASYYIGNKMHIGIIENDFGAINIDRMLLQNLEGDMCQVEQIVGGNTVDDWKRRFKTKLIAFAMQGVQRIIVEPSGIYDVDTFFDALYDEPVCNLCEVGSIITILDAQIDKSLSQKAEYMLLSQIACSGQIVLSKTEGKTQQEIENTKQYLNSLLEKYDCKKDLTNCIIEKDWEEFDKSDFEKLISCGYDKVPHKELHFDARAAFTPLFFMNTDIEPNMIKACVEKLFGDIKCGTVFRVKGFYKKSGGEWIEINATKDTYAENDIQNGQSVIIVIGENLDKEAINKVFEKYTEKC